MRETAVGKLEYAIRAFLKRTQFPESSENDICQPE